MYGTTIDEVHFDWIITSVIPSSISVGKVEKSREQNEKNEQNEKKTKNIS
jgi:hypothetical protein